MSRLNIGIVGAGPAGLVASLSLGREGHNVHVFEGSSALRTTGAGIQIPVNSARILRRLGLLEKIERLADEPEAVCLRRYDSGKLLVNIPLVPVSREVFGAPYLLIHRADFQNLLYDEAVASGIQFSFNAAITKIEVRSGASISCSDGRAFEFDLVVGADGIGSIARKFVLADETTPILPIAHHKIFRGLVEKSEYKPESKGGKAYNLVLVHAGEEAKASHQSSNVDADGVRHLYRDFDPDLRGILDQVQHFSVWDACQLPPLPRWSSKDGRVVLIGDAAHAMLPYSAQGAAQAVEDVVVLTLCLSRCSSIGSMGKALEAYETLRKQRVAFIAAVAQKNGELWHLEDGNAQERRDAAWMEMDQTRIGNQSWGGWDLDSDPKANMSPEEIQRWIVGCDVLAQAEKKLNSDAIAISSMSRNGSH